MGERPSCPVLDDAPTAPPEGDASRICRVVRARLVDSNGNVGKQVVARLGGVLFFADENQALKILGGNFDAEDLGAWCRGTSGRTGQEGPPRSHLLVDRSGRWQVEFDTIRRRRFFREHVSHRVRIGFTGEQQSHSSSKSLMHVGGGSSADVLVLDFGERVDDAKRWSEALTGAVTPIAHMSGVEACEEAEVAPEAVNIEEFPIPSEGIPGDTAKVTFSDEAKSSTVDAKEQEKSLKKVGGSQNSGGALSDLMVSSSSRFVSKASMHVVGKAGTKVLARSPVPVKTPYVFVAKKTVEILYKRRFSLKTVMTRTASQRAYAGLHLTRYAFMRELSERAGAFVPGEQGSNSDGALRELVEGIEEIESVLQELDLFMVGSRGSLRATISVGPGPFRRAKEVTSRRGKSELVSRWMSEDGAQIEETLHSPEPAEGTVK